MYKYLFNTKGKYVAFIYNDLYCFSKTNEYIGFLKGIKLYDYSGKYLGSLTSDDRVIKKCSSIEANVIPMQKPLKPFLPFAPYNRYTMTRLPQGYIDIFMDEVKKLDLSYLDNKYKKFLNCQIYAHGKKFLGIISFDKFDSNSIANKYGNYGSEYSVDSIFNKYGNYGSAYSNISPFNKYTNTPPLIYNNGKEIAVLTANKYYSSKLQIVDSVEFLNWFNFKINKI